MKLNPEHVISINGQLHLTMKGELVQAQELGEAAKQLLAYRWRQKLKYLGMTGLISTKSGALRARALRRALNELEDTVDISYEEVKD